MTAEEFDLSIRFLYGDHDRIAITAMELGIGKVIVRRWANGDREIPGGVVASIRKEVLVRRAALERLLAVTGGAR